jgi:hypothetical protein
MEAAHQAATSVGQTAAAARMAAVRDEVGAGDTAAGAGVVAAAGLLNIADSQGIRWVVGGCRGSAGPLGVARQRWEWCAGRRAAEGADRSH